MKRKDAPFPYEEYYFYQPSFSTKEGRYVINLFHKLNKTHTTISNARFVYETYHQIKLLKNQFVDHKDSNKSNDSIDNLQVLTRQENHNKSLIEYNVKKTFVELCCPNCNNIFVRQKRVTFLCKRNGKFTACSRHCAGIIRQKFQMGESIDLSKNFIRYIIEPAKTGVTF